MPVKVLKEDEYVSKVSEFAVYVDKENKIVGIYATHEDWLVANKNFALKKLRRLCNYKIQMVIK